jgi:hypothetical protein
MMVAPALVMTRRDYFRAIVHENDEQQCVGSTRLAKQVGAAQETAL